MSSAFTRVLFGVSVGVFVSACETVPDFVGMAMGHRCVRLRVCEGFRECVQGLSRGRVRECVHGVCEADCRVYEPVHRRICEQFMSVFMGEQRVL